VHGAGRAARLLPLEALHTQDVDPSHDPPCPLLRLLGTLLCTLLQFLHNVSINLKEGGYFIGTVPDGKRINDCIRKSVLVLHTCPAATLLAAPCPPAACMTPPCLLCKTIPKNNYFHQQSPHSPPLPYCPVPAPAFAPLPLQQQDLHIAHADD
jgi:hypothetical protein